MAETDSMVDQERRDLRQQLAEAQTQLSQLRDAHRGNPGSTINELVRQVTGLRIENDNQRAKIERLEAEIDTARGLASGYADKIRELLAIIKTTKRALDG